MKSDRTYSEEEVSRLIRRAVQLEAERSVSDGESREGLTITELERIAAESGIDPELIHRAASEMNQSEKAGKQEKAVIKKDEIVCERWIEVQPGSRVLDDLVTELNHKYGTTNTDISWWNQLWNDYSGKSRVRKTGTSLEWHYTDEFEMYTTRVLMQKRNDRFRIRVSKRQLWNVNWNSESNAMYYLLPTAVVSLVIGGVLGETILQNFWLGFGPALLLTIVLYPLIKGYLSRSIKKHRDEVTDTANILAELTLQLAAETASVKSSSGKSSSTETIIEIDDETETSESTKTGSGRLRNQLR